MNEAILAELLFFEINLNDKIINIIKSQMCHDSCE